MTVFHSDSSRRTFLKLGACAFLSTGLKGQRILGANNRLRLGILGCGIRGNELLKYFAKLSDVEIVAISDPDTAQMDAMVARFNKNGNSDNIPEVDRIQDYRKLYERPDIDAVAIASPNYWHALQAVQALQSGKHVYLEKPVSFTPWESLQLEIAERKYGKILAAGYQNRSSTGPLAGIAYLQEGNLGKVRKLRSLCYRNRDSIGKLDQPLELPETIDYDLWLGPAQEHTLMRPRLHYDWHWDFHTGNGDIGNQGVHEIDLVCWLLGDPELPTRIQTFGNRFAWDDAGNTPNMITSWFQMGGADVILETNDLKLSPTRNASPNRMGTRVGIIAECEKGYLKGGRFGMVALESDGETIIKKFPGDGGETHQRNFVDAVKAADPSLLRSRVQTASTSASLAHFSNISHRLGELASSAALAEKLSSNDDLSEILADQQKQLSDWGISEPRYLVGKTLQIDPALHALKGRWADDSLTGPNYRKGFELESQS
ncbi:MAG TPA: Gfo/Idh/MocA family oxidoreductase [Opitutales bacterium]|nr:Gfo/Idh/MocA family oxidoreductase [Opitutales bacterium]